MKMAEVPTIPEFFQNKNIFITGGSGFIGKVLIEKLLRSCPGIKNLYLLMRPKQGKSPEERIKIITDLPLFDVLKAKNPSALKKLKLIEGNVMELKLGLNQENYEILKSEVNIIFHGAASVRFDAPLDEAVIMNTRGTRELLRLALVMKNLQALVHVSTTYCNTNHQVIEEKLYPAHANWEKTIEIVENVDKQILNVLTQKFISPLPNTYTFTKSLAEHVIYDMGNGRIPQVIFRPSIVISSLDDPISGWIDNFNGPVGLMLASGKGIVRTAYGDPDIIADSVPVDLVSKALIISAWKKATQDLNEKYETTFFNGSKNNMTPVTMGEVIEIGKRQNHEVPLENILWYPSGEMTKCFYYYYIKIIFYHLIPALFIDGLLKLTGHKPILMKIQRRIYMANMALQYFLLNEWQFKNENCVALENTLLPSDFNDFSYKKDYVIVSEYFLNAKKGARKYLLKEDDESIEQAKKHLNRLWVASVIANTIWYLALAWLIFVKIDLISIIIRKYTDAYIYLTTE